MQGVKLEQVEQHFFSKVLLASDQTLELLLVFSEFWKHRDIIGRFSEQVRLFARQDFVTLFDKWFGCLKVHYNCISFKSDKRWNLVDDLGKPSEWMIAMVSGHVAESFAMFERLSTPESFEASKYLMERTKHREIILFLDEIHHFVVLLEQ